MPVEYSLFNNVANMVGDWSQPKNAQGEDQGIFRRHVLTRFTTAIVGTAAEITDTAVQLIYSPVSAVGAVAIKPFTWTLAHLSKAEMMIKINDSVDNLYDFIKTALKVVGYAIGSVFTLTLGFVSPSANHALHNAFGLTNNVREDQVRLEAQKKAAEDREIKNGQLQILTQEADDICVEAKQLSQKATEASHKVRENIGSKKFDAAKAALQECVDFLDQVKKCEVKIQENAVKIQEQNDCEKSRIFTAEHIDAVKKSLADLDKVLEVATENLNAAVDAEAKAEQARKIEEAAKAEEARKAAEAQKAEEKRKAEANDNPENVDPIATPARGYLDYGLKIPLKVAYNTGARVVGAQKYDW